MKYSVKFCPCGKIHIINNESVWNYMADDYKNRKVVYVCTNCGRTDLLFLDEYGGGFCECSHSLIDEEVESVSKVIADSGISVFTKSGDKADYYSNGYFVNMAEWERHQYDHSSLYEAYKAKENWCTVDTEALKRSIKIIYKNDAQEVIKSIKGYVTKIDWQQE